MDLSVTIMGLSVTTAGKVSLPQHKCNYCGFGVDETNIWKKDILHYINSLVVSDVIKNHISMGTKLHGDGRDIR